MPAAMRTARRSGNQTRNAILNAAVARFSRHSYENARLRDIAADVGVDVALVHRAYGSKEELFASALHAVFDVGFVYPEAREELIQKLLGRLFERGCGGEPWPGDPLAIVVRSLGSEQATPILREFMQRDFLDPVADRLGAGGEDRAALALALLAGVTILRDALGIQRLASERREALQPMLERILRACLEGAADPAPVRGDAPLRPGGGEVAIDPALLG